MSAEHPAASPSRLRAERDYYRRRLVVRGIKWPNRTDRKAIIGALRRAQEEDAR